MNAACPTIATRPLTPDTPVDTAVVILDPAGNPAHVGRLLSGILWSSDGAFIQVYVDDEYQPEVRPGRVRVLDLVGVTA